MVIIYGKKLAGRALEVPGIGEVATQFLHLYYIPLVPVGSYLLFSENEDGFQGAPVGLNLKSVFMAWTRAFFTILAIGFGIFAIIEIAEHHTLLAIFSVVAFIVVVALAWAVGLLKSTATYEQATKLAHKIGADERMMVFLDVQYGRITEAELAAKMAQFEAEDQRADDISAQYAARTSMGRTSGGAIPVPASMQSSSCASCQRKIPPGRDTCLYCGGAKA